MTDWLYNGLIDWLAERVLGMLGGLVSLLTAGCQKPTSTSRWANEYG